MKKFTPGCLLSLVAFVVGFILFWNSRSDHYYYKDGYFAAMLVVVPMILVIGCLVLYDKKKPFLPGCLLSLITVIILFVSICLLLEYVFHSAVPQHELPQ